MLTTSTRSTVVPNADVVFCSRVKHCLRATIELIMKWSRTALHALHIKCTLTRRLYNYSAQIQHPAPLKLISAQLRSTGICVANYLLVFYGSPHIPILYPIFYYLILILLTDHIHLHSHSPLIYSVSIPIVSHLIRNNCLNLFIQWFQHLRFISDITLLQLIFYTSKILVGKLILRLVHWLQDFNFSVRLLAANYTENEDKLMTVERLIVIYN